MPTLSGSTSCWPPRWLYPPIEHLSTPGRVGNQQPVQHVILTDGQIGTCLAACTLKAATCGLSPADEPWDRFGKVDRPLPPSGS